jgi:hypothetical protein
MQASATLLAAPTCCSVQPFKSGEQQRQGSRCETLASANVQQRDGRRR